jgi:hypothetical protein
MDKIPNSKHQVSNKSQVPDVLKAQPLYPNDQTKTKQDVSDTPVAGAGINQPEADKPGPHIFLSFRPACRPDEGRKEKSCQV